MFGFGKSKLPITLDQKCWVDQSFVRLASLVGAVRLTEGEIILPSQEYFPDPYARTEEALQLIFVRVARIMQVDPEEVDVTLFATTEEVTRNLIPYSSVDPSGKGGAAGLYFHDPAVRTHISIDEGQMKDPMSLVAVLAHELGHVILLRPGLVSRDEPDMEPLNDLLMVFLGLGIFTANAAFRFKQFTNNDTQGWSTSRVGYLSEVLGYALARYALERGEIKPAWRSFLATNVATYMKRCEAWLQAQGETKLLP
jgi:hypothetical protein